MSVFWGESDNTAVIGRFVVDRLHRCMNLADAPHEGGHKHLAIPAFDACTADFFVFFFSIFFCPFFVVVCCCSINWNVPFSATMNNKIINNAFFCCARAGPIGPMNNHALYIYSDAWTLISNTIECPAESIGLPAITYSCAQRQSTNTRGDNNKKNYERMQKDNLP